MSYIEQRRAPRTGNIRILDGLRIDLGRSFTDALVVPRGVIAWFRHEIEIPQMVALPEFHTMINGIFRLQLPDGYPVIAQSSERAIRIGTFTHEATQLMAALHNALGGESAVRPMPNGDNIRINNTVMHKGFQIPLVPGQTVEFSAVHTR